MNYGLADEHIFWIVSRAAGTLALLLSSLAVGLGLAMALKLLKGKSLTLRTAHEALSIATIIAIVIHAVSLLGDKYLKPTLADIAVPFVSSYKEPWMSIGIIAGWALIILGLSYYARRRIGVKRWRSLHRFTSLAWIAGIAHSLGEGSDAGMIWFLVCVSVAIVPAGALLWYRVIASRLPARPGRERERGERSGRAPTTAGGFLS